MKKILLLSAVFALVVMSAVPAQAHGHGHGHFGGRVWIGPGWGWWWWPPAYSYYWNPPVVIEQERYMDTVQTKQEQPYYWYFCPDAKNYYPYVKKCPKGWLKVVPPPAPPDQEE